MSCVLFNEHTTRDGKTVLEIVLNSERTLNALTLDMIHLIQPKLVACKSDDSVVAVILNSAGEKAFCAGGDVVNLYKSMSGEGDVDFPQTFFTDEYELDYTLHTYPKPIICWGSGIVMGGGMGLMNGCSHRVVTETSHMAMPEVTIGLYPDVGGSWFLNHMPGNTGLFLGLTGNPINAADALYLGLADRFVASEMFPALIEGLAVSDWSEDASAVVSGVLRQLEHASQPQLTAESQVKAHAEVIRQVTDHDTVDQMVDALLAIDSEDKWIKRSQKAISHGSPLAVKLIKRQLDVTRHMSLRECFMAELVLSVQCCRHREFPEGVRALLVDKCGNPEWTYSTLAEIEDGALDEFFVSPWDINPLETVI